MTAKTKSPTAQNSNSTKSKELELAELFAMPLLSLIDADVYAAESFAEFINDFGFEPPETTEALPTKKQESFGKLRMVTFNYDRVLSDGKLHTFKVQIPWLSLVPLPNLTIKQAKVSFAVQMLSAMGGDDGVPLTKAVNAPPPSVEGSAAPPLLEGTEGGMKRSDKRKIKTQARIGRATEGQSKLAMQLDVDVTIERSDLPAGMASLLNVMSNAVDNAPAQAKLLFEAHQNTLQTSGETTPFLLILTGPHQNPVPNAFIGLTGVDRKLLKYPTSLQTNADGKAWGEIQLRQTVKESQDVQITATTNLNGKTNEKETTNVRDETIKAFLNLKLNPPQTP